jgi:hypothetical protein
MRVSQKWTLIGLLALAGAAIAGLIRTGGSGHTPQQSKTAPTALTDSQLINQRHLDTARRLSALAATPEEQQLAQDALRITDRELDLEFAAALQTSAHQSGARAPEVRALQERIGKIEAAIPAKQGEVNQLTETAKKAKGDRRDDLQEQIDVSQAQLGLYQEVLADAKEDLIRAGGDPHSKVQELVAEHDAASHAAESVKFVSTSEATPAGPAGSLLAKWSKWNVIRHKQDQIIQAQQEASTEAAALARNHDALEQQVEKEQAEEKVVAGRLTSPLKSGDQSAAQPMGMNSREAAAAAVSSLQRLSEDRKSEAIMGKRIRDFQELASTYGQWALLVKADQRSAAHDMIESALWIVLTLLTVFVINRLIDHFFARLTLEQKQRATLHAVVRFSVQAVAVLVILFVTFGKPSQLSTILGLATAGLTVALKDFIVSFMGWFVLMGRNGIHVGDWVEINDVRGEGIEIGLLRTVLLETGNWTAAGQPTGRQVTFLNSFAVEGHYFNFSSSGQWLWDEVEVLIPEGRNPYPLVEEIRDIVVKETEGNAQTAELEWQRVKHRSGVRSYPAEPTVNVKPIDHGVAVILRYVVRAHERSEVRSRLNQAVVKLLHQETDATPPAESRVAPPAPGPR